MIESFVYGATIEGFAVPVGSPLCSTGAGFKLASAGDASRSPAIGLLSHYSQQKNFNCRVAAAGFLTLKDWTQLTGSALLVPQENYYLSTVAGKLTANPEQAGSIASQLLGVAISTTTLQVTVTSPKVVASSVVIGTIKSSPNPGSGKVLTSNPDGTYSPTFPQAHTGDPINAMDDFGAKGDGIADDADALQNAALAGWAPDWVSSTNDRWRPVYLPPGRYRVTHPIAIPVSREFYGAGIGQYGTELWVDPAFNANWNLSFADHGIVPTAAYPLIDRIPAAVLQTTTWAPDPKKNLDGSWAQRWPFNGTIHWDPALGAANPNNIGSFLDGTRIRNLVISCNNVPGVGGFYADSIAESALFQGVWIRNATGPGIWLTGSCSSPSFERCGIWFCGDGAVKITSNPFFYALPRGNRGDGNLDGYTGGTVLFNKMTGDGNQKAYFYNTTYMNIVVESLKYEFPWAVGDPVVLFDVDPILAGTGKGFNAGGRMSFTMLGGSAQAAIALASPNYAPELQATSFIRIKKTNSSDHREWIRPVISIIGMQYYHRNILVDDSHQTWDDAVNNRDIATPLTLGLDGVGMDYTNSRGPFFYSNDTNEVPNFRFLSMRFSGYAMYFPDGTYKTGAG